jgi:uncharacterized integral membrane protein
LFLKGKKMKNLLHNWGPFALIILILFLLLLGVAQQKFDFPFVTYPGILVAMSSGFLGATFSMLIQNQRRVSEGTLEDLDAASNWHTLIVRGSVGLGAAVILYFFFESGLLEGSLWPDLQKLAFNNLESTRSAGVDVPNQHWCLLVIWCFLAGFSETLVPNILKRTEEKSSAT